MLITNMSLRRIHVERQHELDGCDSNNADYESNKRRLRQIDRRIRLLRTLSAFYRELFAQTGGVPVPVMPPTAR
jgi:transcription elongation GreA/GreB family factor